MLFNEMSTRTCTMKMQNAMKREVSAYNGSRDLVTQHNIVPMFSVSDEIILTLHLHTNIF
jgi:hypothetical protein